MVSVRATLIAALAAMGSCLPSTPRLSLRQLSYYDLSRRQNDIALAQGLSDIDILQIALTLEHLEEAYYRQGFALFPPSDFTSIGLTPSQQTDLQLILASEATHVTTLQSTIAQAGFTPVSPCSYDFSALAPDAAHMISSGAVVENIGMSAYLGAATLVHDKGVLGVAASILTVEARHQTALRVFGGLGGAAPQAFDAGLGLRAVFSLAAPFIKSCPEGSNLVLEAFAPLVMADGSSSVAIAAQVNTNIAIQAGDGADASNAAFCAFTSGGVVPGGTTFTTFSQKDGCPVPEAVAGITYVFLSSDAPSDGVLADELIVAGPMVLTIS